jgi:hypothetical protein
MRQFFLIYPTSLKKLKYVKPIVTFVQEGSIFASLNVYKCEVPTVPSNVIRCLSIDAVCAPLDLKAFIASLTVVMSGLLAHPPHDCEAAHVVKRQSYQPPASVGSDTAFKHFWSLNPKIIDL